MGLKFYVGEAQARSSQAAQLNGQAGQAIASLQSSIQLFLSAPLSSKAYDSAKNYFMVAYTPLCQSAIMTGEALESAHKKFLSDYQGSVSGIDTDEDLILEEINRFEDLKRDLDQQMSTAKTPRPDLERRYMNACDVITQRREKLAKFHAYNGRSASIFSEYQACQQEFNAGLAQVKECKAWNPASGTFDLRRLNMSWAKPITARWKQREKMRQEKLKNGSTGKANTLADHGLTEADLVQVSDPPELVYQKYIKFAALGLNPHTGKPLTDKEKWQFQYAAHAGTMSDLIGLVGGAYAGNKAFNNTQKKPDVLRGNRDGKNYTLDRNNSNGNYKFTKPPINVDLSRLTPGEISKMTLDELRASVPEGWEMLENNGRVHIKDTNGNYRVRIDPPDNKTKYDHMHLFDSKNNPLDINGKIVDRKSPDGHIPWDKK